MYRRLSLALLLLSASLCGMKRNEGECLRNQGVFAVLKAKFFRSATPLPDSSEATAEEEALKKEQPDAESSGPGASHMCMGSDISSFSRAIPTQRCFFPGEQGEGNYY